MYAHHFKLTGEPFSLTPDPSFLYLSPSHAEALAALKIGLESRRGLLVMIGEVGTGKTTLLYSLLSALGNEVRTAYVANTLLCMEEILQAALADWHVPCEDRSKSGLLQALNGFLLRCAEENATAALVIDEAQNLDEQAFENIRLLSNFESFTSKLLQIVLVGQPELAQKLRRQNLRQVAERVAVRCHVNPLNRGDLCKYVAHRLECVGGSPALFTRGALRLLARHSAGIPRRINILCHNALLFAYGRDARYVTAASMRAAIREWQGKGLITQSERWRSSESEAGLAIGQPAWPRSAWVRVLQAVGAAMLVLTGVAAEHWSHATPSTISAVVRPPAPVPPPPPVEAVAGDAPVTEVAQPTPELRPADLRRPEPVGLPFQPGFVSIEVPPGATLFALARQTYGDVTPALLERIKRANPHIVNVNHIRAGDTLRFPAADLPALRSAQSNHE